MRYRGLLPLFAGSLQGFKGEGKRGDGVGDKPLQRGGMNDFREDKRQIESRVRA